MSDEGVEEFSEDEERIYFAITGDDSCTLKRLLDDGLDANFKFVGSNQLEKSALHLSCETGNIECAKVLLDHGCFCDPVDTFDQTPLFYSIISERIDMVSLLLDAGANPNLKDRFGKTAAHFAIANNTSEILKLLIKMSVNLNFRDEKGKSPLWMAVSEDGNLPHVQTLIQGGCDLNSKDYREKRTPLQVAILNTTNDTMAYVSTLLDNGASCNTTDQFGHTPMMTLIRRGRRKDKTNVQEDDLRIAELLLVKGYNPDTVSVGTQWYQFHGTALKMAADRGAVPLVRVLLKAGADPDLTDDRSVTPLLLAAFNNFLDVAKELIGANCRLDISGEVKIERTALNLTPFKCAILLGHLEMAQLLVLAGYNLHHDSYISLAPPPLNSASIGDATTSDDIPDSLLQNAAFWMWLREERERPWCLANLARHYIRRMLGHSLDKKLHDLPLPRWTKDYLMLKELLATGFEEQQKDIVMTFQ